MMTAAAVQESELAHEAGEFHTRLLKCTLAVDESRAYWGRRATMDRAPSSVEAFEQFWFGAKSLPRVEVLLANMRSRFEAFPEALWVLSRWRPMDVETRSAICHWHLQLSDPLYRLFSGEFLAARRATLHAQVSRPAVIAWLGDLGRDRWNVATRTELASKLLTAALSAGLVAGRRDPRDLRFPRVGDEAFSYLLYLLRETEFAGNLIDNPYLLSVGLDATALPSRLAALPSIQFQRVADAVDFGWRYRSLRAWAESEVLEGDAQR